ncbi:hypothetical protein AG1IA_06247 [Rhizoctonia solani AG-1 IA]|uniref:Uncharacterized protein n=1 Tax=Thanatephorus cucumeris (strain AG1-IA) TaxID=983506 RepID=L8WTN8_THACA|nr:hypothetical protein AG1IA_06247 [Rhizoctonia solani AG-1 IA]
MVEEMKGTRPSTAHLSASVEGQGGVSLHIRVIKDIYAIDLCILLAARPISRIPWVVVKGMPPSEHAFEFKLRFATLGPPPYLLTGRCYDHSKCTRAESREVASPTGVKVNYLTHVYRWRALRMGLQPRF